MKRPVPVESASTLIDKKIKELGDWRGKTLAKVREIIHEADPEIVEEWKWMGTPVWSHGGIVCTGETYKNVVKMTFAKGAALKDPSGLFNSSLDGNVRRAIDIHEGDKVDEAALKDLIRAAVALNLNQPQRVPFGYAQGLRNETNHSSHVSPTEGRTCGTQQAGRLASSQVPWSPAGQLLARWGGGLGPYLLSSIGEELRHLPHTPSSSTSRPRTGRWGRKTRLSSLYSRMVDQRGSCQFLRSR